MKVLKLNINRIIPDMNIGKDIKCISNVQKVYEPYHIVMYAVKHNSNPIILSIDGFDMICSESKLVVIDVSILL